MNWLGKLIQNEVVRDDTVLDIGCGIMQATTDILHKKFGGRGNKGRLRCRRITGTDIHQAYLSEINRYYDDIETIHMSVEDTCKTIRDDQYDVVLCLDVLEHLDPKTIPMVIENIQRIARRKAIVYTPSTFKTNEEHAENVWGMGSNEFQLHQSLVDPQFLEARGFVVSYPPPDRNTLGIYTKR
jgi:2-polyprenyl-3-methyl-5-hydroxy-6-metoxy-1,4-benzoquinol methylase